MAISVPIILFIGGLGILFVAYLLQLVHMVHEEQQRHLHTVSSPFLALVTTTCVCIFIYGIVLQRRETIIAGLVAALTGPALMISLLHVHHPPTTHAPVKPPASRDELCHSS